MSKTKATARPSTPLPTPVIVDAKQAAKFLNISIHTVRWLTKTRQIPFVRLGKRLIKFDLNRLAEWLSDRESVDVRYKERTTD